MKQILLHGAAAGQSLPALARMNRDYRMEVETDGARLADRVRSGNGQIHAVLLFQDEARGADGFDLSAALMRLKPAAVRLRYCGEQRRCWGYFRFGGGASPHLPIS